MPTSDECITMKDLSKITEIEDFGEAAIQELEKYFKDNNLAEGLQVTKKDLKSIQ